ncbi:hypothetical protein [Paenibacillus naphthalenovorans]|uniref:Uncharacterized protein n=1 Tax=Paenibacillus naphthalenovorans TaxID=162209 RepID=A0A0U2UBW9_9BACL|nr:hypothetical protein [Paenibacillus naphthalenovorans]ALS23753.1 hypothetical protein IJ22_33920 [Paenibacillus naphthalenovorans]
MEVIIVYFKYKELVKSNAQLSNLLWSLEEKRQLRLRREIFWVSKKLDCGIKLFCRMYAQHGRHLYGESSEWGLASAYH